MTEQQRKAMEMALEALSEYTGVVTSGTDPTKWNEVVDGGGPAREAIQALRQALAQPEQEPVSQWYEGYNKGFDAGVSLTPPKREWVGLIAPEVNECYDLNPAKFASNIEAKLKEKNT